MYDAALYIYPAVEGLLFCCFMSTVNVCVPLNTFKALSDEVHRETIFVLFIIFHIIYDYTIKGANNEKIMVFLCLPSRKIIVLHDRSKSTTRKSCK